jgi:hypothetical protein
MRKKERKKKEKIPLSVVNIHVHKTYVHAETLSGDEKDSKKKPNDKRMVILSHTNRIVSCKRKHIKVIKKKALHIVHRSYFL